MSSNQELLNQLQSKIDALSARQQSFGQEIERLKTELRALNKQEFISHERSFSTLSQPITPPNIPTPLSAPEQVSHTSGNQSRTSWIKKPDIEKWIGENLINKIGIAITIIGVAIGIKYSVENNLISPITRVILGYVMALGFLGVGIKLKENYHKYSAVLVSGSIAMLYFITFFSYSIYALIPVTAAFSMMLVFTLFAIVAAVQYNQKVIAHIGLVGSYAIPFLLSEGNGNEVLLFSYIALINVGILIISFLRYWKSLYYSSFIFSWAIYALWLINQYDAETQYALAWSFLILYFITFYTTSISYKIKHKLTFGFADIMMFMSNSVIFFAFGYLLLVQHSIGSQYLGLFSLSNAVFHFVVSKVLYQKQLVDKSLFYLMIGMVIVLVSIAIPMQLDGNWVTILWSGEAALLFWIGRTKKIAFYEKMSYPLMIIGFYSLSQDWLDTYNGYDAMGVFINITPLWNVYFLSSMLFVGAFVFMTTINLNLNHSSTLSSKTYKFLTSYLVPTILLISSYYTFRLEIANYWQQLFVDSQIKSFSEELQYYQFFENHDLTKMKTVWILNYSMFFAIVITLFNIIKMKSKELGWLNFVLIIFSVFLFLTQGLYALGQLRDSYLSQELAEYYDIGMMNITLRYISYLFVSLALWVLYGLGTQNILSQKPIIAIEMIVHTAILWMLTSEIIHWMAMLEATYSYKLSVSILWGVYGLFLVTLGIWKSKKVLRISAFGLLAITLIKLFLYDISHLESMAKTVVFISLGLLLLVISFLYNKFKHLINPE